MASRFGGVVLLVAVAMVVLCPHTGARGTLPPLLGHLGSAAGSWLPLVGSACTQGSALCKQSGCNSFVAQ